MNTTFCEGKKEKVQKLPVFQVFFLVQNFYVKKYQIKKNVDPCQNVFIMFFINKLKLFVALTDVCINDILK